jgi:glucose/mannose-6-phosphate isomerase
VAAPDEDRLDDVERLAAGDPDGMLREVLGAPAQVRAAATAAAEVDLGPVLDLGRPRSVVVAGMGGSGIAGDVLGALTGLTCPVPVLTHRGYGLPGWVGPADVVVGVSCSGTTEETLSAVDEAARRGAALVTVGAAGSRLAAYAEQAKAPHFDVPGGRLPRAALWSLVVPLVRLGDALGLLRGDAAVLDATADRLDELTERCRPDKESFLNPAKSMAVRLSAGLPACWGTTPLAGVAAYRFAGQLAENAKAPSVWGVLPEAHHNQVVWFDGDSADSVTLVLLRDSDEHPQLAKRAEATLELARERRIDVEVVAAEGDAPLERLASLVAMVDFASVYLALLTGVDPSAMRPITELKERIAR